MNIVSTNTRSEIIDLSTSEGTECPSWKKYPYHTEGAVGGFLGTNPIVCGGKRYNFDDIPIEYSNECHIIRPKKAENFTKMLSKRHDAASLVIKGKTLWISGGNDGIETLSSSEFIESERATSLAGPDLPLALEGHKMIEITDDLTLLIGGSLTKTPETCSHRVFRPSKHCRFKI